VIKEISNINVTDNQNIVFDLAVEERIIEYLVNKDKKEVRKLIQEIHPADIADLLEHIRPDQREILIDFLGAEFNPKILTELNETVFDQVINHLGIDRITQALGVLNSDDVIEIFEELDKYKKQQILDSIPPFDRAIIEKGLSYPKDSAGRLMQQEVATVPNIWNVGDTIDFFRSTLNDEYNSSCNLPNQFYDLFVVDSEYAPIGVISLCQLLQANRDTMVSDLMDINMKILPSTIDQEEVAFIFRQRDLVSAPVVDLSGHLVGVITIDDVVDVIHEELGEDLMRLGGVQEGDIYDTTFSTTKARFLWLLVNLITAVIASAVIGLFDATLDQMVALAILMPIVASMGGNAGTQTLTVVVRALALKELTSINTARVIGKEALIGLVNGILFAILIGFAIWIWFSNIVLALVIGLAMVVNMFVAGLAGIIIPISFEKFDIDPAIASSVVLTAITDVIGFFVFLGLAAILLF